MYVSSLNKAQTFPMEKFIFTVLLTTLAANISVFSRQAADTAFQVCESGKRQQPPSSWNTDNDSSDNKNRLPDIKFRYGQDFPGYFYPNTNKCHLKKRIPAGVLFPNDAVFNRRHFPEIFRKEVFIEKYAGRYSDNMPVYYPKEYFPALIYKPDPSVWFPSLNPVLP
jgi:hypothetical protein